MKILKIKFGLFSLLAVLAVSVFLTSCEQEIPENPITTESSLLVGPTIVELSEDNATLTSYKESEDIRHFDSSIGNLSWDNATMTINTAENAAPVLTIPIISEDESSTVNLLYVVYNNQDDSFLSIINSFDVSQLTDANEGYTGTMEFKTIENKKISSSVFNKGELVTHNEFISDEINYRGLDFGCFFKCAAAAGVGVASAGAFGVSCLNAFNGCRSWPSSWNPSCWALAGCAVVFTGQLGICAYECWD